MIIRKPYAFFIKNFRLFHILFLFLSFILLSNTISLYEFFHKYISKTAVIISTFEISSVIVNCFWGVLLLIGLSIVMGVLIYKKKPIKFYLVQIIIYILVLILFVICNNSLNELTKYLVDIRVLKALHDILFVFCIVEAICMVLLFTRATSFDIKSFDFDKEYNALVADESDREEVEVAFDFDFNTIKTKVNKLVRDFKYFYLENKLVSLMLVGLGVIALIVSGIIYMKSSPYIKVSGNTISKGLYRLQYKGFYLDDSNIKNNIVDEKSLFIIADVDIKTSSNRTFNTSNLMLYIDNDVYTPNSSYNQYFTDFGIGYNLQEIKKEGRYYFVYKIPKSVNLDKLQLVYHYNDDYYLKNIKYIDLRDDVNNGTYSIGDTIKIESKFLNSTDFVINEVDFKDKFLVPYIYKTGKVNYNSSFYVSPSISGNYDKSVMRISSNNCELITNYGELYYKENDTLIKANVPLKQITNLKKNYDFCYYETDKEVVGAKDVLLKINVRGNIYNYYLK